jgi:putative oxidoreductase
MTHREEKHMLVQSDNLAKLLLRLAVGGLMIFHGIAKLVHGIEWLGPVVTGNGLPEFVKYGVYLGEVLGPAMVILGYRTRIGALLVVADMLFAIGLVHRHLLLSIGQGGGWAIELPAFYLIAALAVFFAGPGSYSVSGGGKAWG